MDYDNIYIYISFDLCILLYMCISYICIYVHILYICIRIYCVV